jgi:hypothetical protein
MAAMTNPAPGSADLVPRRQLEKSVSWSAANGSGASGTGSALTIAEMKYATRRMVELQAPWVSDDHPGR